ncbi:MAG: electron transfer flavoprotein subunit beta/FixA family protein [Deltaproteobacteria bacterium]|mgnify:CR=1 FL=1|nr:electron transfer flavoprotein subunit beta/FixA family protein [Deltaproteobacteria bacterium]
MNIIVCIKRVPDTADADISIDKSGKDIEKGGLAFDLNEWDSYAIEEAILLKEKLGGTVTVLSAGGEDSNESLRKCLAMGADDAFRLTDPAFAGADGFATARVLAEAIRKRPFDLILTGTQAEDDGYGQVGVAMAEMLGVPHVSIVNRIEVQEKKIKAHRELEGGLEEVVEVDLPALLTIQTGINEPRYVSIMGIRKVTKKEIKTFGASDLNLKPEEVGLSGSDIQLEKVFLPSVGEGAEMLEGKPEEIALKFFDILKDKGGVA